jgi:hypothetical protein
MSDDRASVGWRDLTDGEWRETPRYTVVSRFPWGGVFRPRLTALDLKRQPVRNDLWTCVPIERCQRTINRRKRAKRTLPVERPLQALEARPQIGVRETAFVRAGK